MPTETAIGKLVRLALEFYDRGDYEEALLHASIALDATAGKEYPKTKQNNLRYKMFIKDNLNIVTGVGFRGFAVAGLHLQCAHPHMPAQAGISHSIEAILYHAVRCTLLHEGSVPPVIRITTDGSFGGAGSPTLIPHTIVLGLLLSVVAAVANRDEHMQGRIGICFGELKWRVNDLWGRRPEVHRAVVDQCDKLRKRAQEKGHGSKQGPAG